jgi:hypothetical protein
MGYTGLVRAKERLWFGGRFISAGQVFEVRDFRVNENDPYEPVRVTGVERVKHSSGYTMEKPICERLATTPEELRELNRRGA